MTTSPPTPPSRSSDEPSRPESNVTEALRQDRGKNFVRRLTLHVDRDGDGAKEETYASTGDRIVIGTHESVDVVLQDTSVSRFHCEIVIESGRVLIRDLESLNGTIVDGTSILSAHLRNGALILIGRTQIRVDLGAAAEVEVPVSSKHRFGHAVGRSFAMRRAFATLERAAEGDATVLLEGETGTGKEVLAESLHAESARRDGPFIVVDCAAVPHDLLESELFGHERGAFTGAHTSRVGAFEAAAGGTLFLDEIGELDLDLQPKLLRVLEKKEIKRIGKSTYSKIDVRLVAATHRSLRSEVNEKRFRADLYYRLAVINVRVPSLRERPDDLPLLVEHHLANMRATLHPHAVIIRSPEFLATLARHGWPGNVRELRTYIERCLALSPSAPLNNDDNEHAAHASSPIDASMTLEQVRTTFAKLEGDYLRALVARHQNNVAAAARAAGVDRAHLYRMLWRNGIR